MVVYCHDALACILGRMWPAGLDALTHYASLLCKSLACPNDVLPAHHSSRSLPVRLRLRPIHSLLGACDEPVARDRLVDV
jgi:hypothetical protein